MKPKFITFIESLKTDENNLLIEAVKKAFFLIESEGNQLSGPEKMSANLILNEMRSILASLRTPNAVLANEGDRKDLAEMVDHWINELDYSVNNNGDKNDIARNFTERFSDNHLKNIIYNSHNSAVVDKALAIKKKISNFDDMIYGLGDYYNP